MKILINYANWRSHFARRYNSFSGIRAASMDRVIEYSPKDVARDYRRRNRKLFRRIRGAGYWLWKPWIIAETLKLMKEEDVLVYSDAGIIFLHPIEPLLQRMEETGQDVMAFLNPQLDYHREEIWTKRDAFILLDCDRPEYAGTTQCWAGFHLWKKTEFSMEFVREWLHYIQDERIVSDRPNELGSLNYPGFQEHRHDQSIFSLLAKKHGLILHRHPSSREEGGGGDSRDVRRFPEDRYPRMVIVPRINVNEMEVIRDVILPGWATYIRSPNDLIRSLLRLFLPRNVLLVLKRFVRDEHKINKKTAEAEHSDS